MNLRNRAIVAGLTAVLAFGSIAPVAYATPQSELAEASSRLETLGGELSRLQGELDEKASALEDTSYRIGEKESQIKETKKELAAARHVLRGRMRSSYKSGGSSLLEVLLGATSLDDIISRIYYMDKIASNDAAAIFDVQKLEKKLDKERSDLEKTKAEQEKAVEELEAQVGEYSVKVSEAQQYYDSLDAQVQAELAAQQEAAENERIQAAIQAVEQEQAAAEAQERAEAAAPAPVEDDAVEEEVETTPTDTNDDEQEEEEETEDTTSSDSGSSGSGTSKQVPGYGGLGTAYAAIGCPYVYGAAGPSSFDCSGLVCYCYGFGRGRTTYDLIASLQSTGSWKTSMDQLQPGDLVFPSEGHVGIYTGGGMMIHAPTPGRYVCEAPVYAFIGGGTF